MLIIATGSRPNQLKCESDKDCGKKYIGKGMTPCAACDAPLFKDKKVIVIGGGIEALREMATLNKYTKDITVLNKSNALHGPKMLLDHVTENKNIKVLNNVTAIDIISKDGYAVGIKIRDNDTGAIKTIPSDGIFVAIGWKPESELFNKLVNTNQKGEIITDNMQTSHPAILAAGSVTTESIHQAFTDAAEGYRAAVASEKTLCVSKGVKNEKSSISEANRACEY